MPQDVMKIKFTDELFDAVDNCNLSKIRELLRNGGDVNAELLPGGWTALHVAVDRGYYEMTKLLLAFNADVNAKVASGKTPLTISEIKGYKEIEDLLRIMDSAAPSSS